MKIDRPLNTNIDNFKIAVTNEVHSEYFSVPVVIKRYGQVVCLELASAYQVHSWNSGTTQIYPTTPSNIAPGSTKRMPIFRNQTCIGYISIAPTSGLYINSASAINDGGSQFNAFGMYLYNM